MNAHDLVNYLLQNGFTQKSLAQKLTDEGVITRQPTICRMAKKPNYNARAEKWLLLNKLYEKTKASKSNAITSKSNQLENSPAGERNQKIETTSATN